MTDKSCRPEDFEALVSRQENRLYRAALSIMGDLAEAEDMVQEALAKAWEKQPQFVSPEHEKAWLLRVLINLCKNQLRAPWRKRSAPLLDTYPAQDQEQRELLEQVLALPPNTGR